MSHLHFPDGIIQPIWWISGFFLSLLILFFCLKFTKSNDIAKKIPLAGIFSALMLVTMSIPLGFLPFHINLAVLTGIIIGPTLGFISVFIVNFIIALFGHGGITVVGLNSFIIGMELISGYYFFKLLKKIMNINFSIILAVFFALLISNSLMIGTFFVNNIDFSELAHNHHHHHDSCVHNCHNHDHQMNNKNYIAENQKDSFKNRSNVEEFENHENCSCKAINFLSFTGWIAFIIIWLIGTFIEITATILVISFLKKIRPDLIK